MKRIDINVLWDNARGCITNEEYGKRNGILPPKPQVATLNELLEIIEKEYSPVTRKVLKVNDCRCADDVVLSSHNEIWGVMRDFFSQHLDWVRGEKEMPPTARRELARKRGKIHSDLARQKRCHFTSKGFVCYCDEHQH